MPEEVAKAHRPEWAPFSLRELGLDEEEAEEGEAQRKAAVDAGAILDYKGGETAALARLHEYFWELDKLKEYKETRNGMLGPHYSSKFSPWLASGNVSPRVILSEVKRYEKERVANDSTYWLVFELIWRDFFKFIAMRYGNDIFKLGGPQRDAAKYPWVRQERLYKAWVEGRTGVPLIDACMRELRATGFLGNRGRQIVASFCTKDLLLDWRMGAAYFEEVLLDYDPASNYGNWNYVAGVGSDPREDRYFNPVSWSV
jgi:deoxyribodipyrimidine photo-lyase